MDADDNFFRRLEQLARTRPRVWRLFLLEEKRGEVNQVVTPDQPCMKAWGFNLRDRHLFCLEEVDQFAIGLDERVLSAARDPEKAKVGGLWIEPMPTHSHSRVYGRRS